MAQGPGRYNDACTVARDLTDAETCILVVIGGKHGHGFEVQSIDGKAAVQLPRLLRDMADMIESGQG